MSRMIGKRMHMSQSVQGPLINWSDEEWEEARHWCLNNGEKLSSGLELKRIFVNLAYEGWRVIPVHGCDNFDKEKGCLGHD